MTETLTEMLMKAMQANGLSYGVLAEQARCSKGSVHRIMHGKDRPRRNTLLRLCFALRLDVQEAERVLELARLPGLDSE